MRTTASRLLKIKMSLSINFRIYFPPGYEQTILNIRLKNMKSKLKTVQLNVKNSEILIVQKHINMPAIEGTEVAVEAETYIYRKEEAYRMLQEIWNQVIKDDSMDKMPFLVISDRGAFIRNSDAYHNIPCNFGFGVMPFSGLYVSYVRRTSRGSVIFYHDERRMKIMMFPEHAMTLGMMIDVVMLTGCEVLKLSYNNISSIIVNCDRHSVVLYLVLLHPPLLYHERTELNPGRCMTTSKRMREFPELPADVIGRANVLQLSLPVGNATFEIISRLRYRCGQLPVMYGKITHLQLSAPSLPQWNFRYFSCQYLFSAITNRNFFVAEQLRQESLVGKQNFPSRFPDEKALEKALTEIFFAVDTGRFINFWEAVSSLYEHYITHAEEKNFMHYVVPAKSRLIRRVTITPTRTLLWPPEIMFENRVLRNFNPDFALRVNFRDDDISRLSYNANFTSDCIFQYAIKEPMTQGLYIGGRRYRFLGWSNSQIRDHGVWMYARDEKNKGIEDIRTWMGDFSSIHCVAKYMSRMGQTFSQTEDTVSVPLDVNNVRTEDDIECRSLDSNTVYCFSDGIGKISVSLAKKVQEVLGHDKHCSAFQIRYGGYKGMLVTDPTLKGVDIVFRKSMKKFDSPANTRLEIAKTSAPIPLFLNRPFITILNQMGVPTKVFLSMQENMLRTLTDMLLYEDKAALYLKSKLPTEIFSMNELHGSGISLTTEPFFRCLLLALHRHCVHNVKTKANITVDPSKGRNMLGVLDETGKLQYGQVFVQYTTDISYGETLKETTIVKGTVLVTKNPCMHPGDVRKFQAVDIPELHHIIDCIVFPQNGCRPHPNEMAGSDLDGDEYAVLWDKDLIFKKSNHPAANFPSHPAPQKFYITDSDIIDFLVEYIKNDQVGVIANTHLAQADQLGIFSRKCESIASKFSVAVDFPKTGAQANHFHLTRDEKPKQFPDFMEKHYIMCYHSKRALGKMFRVCKDFETENQHASLSYSETKVDPGLVYEGWKKYEADAIRSRDKYNSLLSFILKNHGVQHEAEALSGAFTRLHCRYNERRDKADIEKIVTASIKALCKNMKNEFYGGLKGIQDAKTLATEILKKASAWYVVTYQQQNPEFLSFPWLLSKVLANIKLKGSSTSIVFLASPLTVKLDTMIMKLAADGKLPQLPDKAVQMFKSYSMLCDRNVLEAAFRAVMQWAMDMQLVQWPECERNRFMYMHTLITLFLFVAERECFISSVDHCGSDNTEKETDKTAADLFLAFMGFCVKLRFINKLEVKQLLPFAIYKHKHLAKHSMNTYHQIAIKGTCTVLQHDKLLERDIYEMKEEYIDCGLHPHLTHDANLRKIMEALKKYSGVESISMRPHKNIKKIIVSAEGNENSIHMLRTVIRKGQDVISRILTSDVMDALQLPR